MNTPIRMCTYIGRIAMLDDFFVRALLAGVGAALVAGPLGCFVVWRRMAYFGDTLSHSALLGVAVALLFDVNVTLAVFAVSILVALLLVALQRRATLSADSLLGLLAHSALALGLVALGFLTWVRVDLTSYLFGDILAVSSGEVLAIWVGGALVLAVLAYVWRPLFAATVSRELAEAEGAAPDRADLIYIALMATVIALAMKIVGVLLITAMLIVPAAAARRLAGGPEQMAVLAALIGAAAAVAGLFGSLQFDTPAGPSIVVAALGLFILSLVPGVRGGIRHTGGA
jgi:zinc transport system permease protein